jgi:hypothetical protein
VPHVSPIRSAALDGQRASCPTHADSGEWGVRLGAFTEH